MVDVTARFRKHGGADRLEPGEVLVAVVVTTPKGSYVRGLGAAALGRAIVAPVAAPVPGASDLAAYLPPAALHLALTDRRLAAFGTNGTWGTKPGEHLVSYGREHVSGFEHRVTPVRIQCTLVFADGSASEFEVERSKNTDRFVDAVTRWLPSSST